MKVKEGILMILLSVLSAFIHLGATSLITIMSFCYFEISAKSQFPHYGD